MMYAVRPITKEEFGRMMGEDITYHSRGAERAEGLVHGYEQYYRDVGLAFCHMIRNGITGEELDQCISHLKIRIHELDETLRGMDGDPQERGLRGSVRNFLRGYFTAGGHMERCARKAVETYRDNLKGFVGSFEAYRESEFSH
ncbi:MAG: hypothetical protein HY518_02595 [Candidatus Aenigmarchaeota archaeon]|nr:hypothetical protein [Candidatus Aenigmarchaeota archaeon]